MMSHHLVVKFSGALGAPIIFFFIVPIVFGWIATKVFERDNCSADYFLASVSSLAFKQFVSLLFQNLNMN